MSDIHFYTNPQSRGRIVHWLLEELGEPYETHNLQYGGSMKEPEYLAINPMGKVPAITHKGAVVTEVPAICAYLASAYPQSGLLPPAGSPASAAYFRWLFFAAGPVEQAVTTKSMGWQATAEQQPTLGFGSYDATINTLELALANGPYICGEQFTAADVYVGSHLTWGLMFETIEKRPKFVEYVERLATRPAAVRANTINEEQLKKSQ